MSQGDKQLPLDRRDGVKITVYNVVTGVRLRAEENGVLIVERPAYGFEEALFARAQPSARLPNEVAPRGEDQILVVYMTLEQHDRWAAFNETAAPSHVERRSGPEDRRRNDPLTPNAPYRRMSAGRRKADAARREALCLRLRPSEAPMTDKVRCPSRSLPSSGLQLALDYVSLKRTLISGEEVLFLAKALIAMHQRAEREGATRLIYACQFCGRENTERLADLKEKISDAAYEWAKYVHEDTAPVNLVTHMEAAFDAAVKEKSLARR